MLVARGFSLNVATGLPLLYEPRVAERLITVANFKIFASLLRVLDFPSPEIECDDLWCRFEPRAYSVQAYCRQLVCAIALLVLQNEVEESHASVFERLLDCRCYARSPSARPGKRPPQRCTVHNPKRGKLHNTRPTGSRVVLSSFSQR